MILEKLQEIGSLSYLEEYRWEIKFLPKTTKEHTKCDEFITDIANYFVIKTDIQKDILNIVYQIPVIEKIPTVDIVNYLTQANIWAIQTEIQNRENAVEFVIQSEFDTSVNPDWKLHLDGSGTDALKLEVSYKVIKTHIFK